MKETFDEVTKLLKDSHIRPSIQRVKVLEYLHEKGGHPTVDEIFRALAAEIPSLSRVTIYNTLHTFVDAGLVHVVDIDEIEKHYDITLASHGHFQCEACGKIYNFHVNIDQVPIDGLNQFQVTQKNIYFRGRCPNCLDQPVRSIRRKQND
jgi:Fe2+ or Zn2+ uptake regulation protein